MSTEDKKNRDLEALDSMAFATDKEREEAAQAALALMLAAESEGALSFAKACRKLETAARKAESKEAKAEARDKARAERERVRAKERREARAAALEAKAKALREEGDVKEGVEA